MANGATNGHVEKVKELDRTKYPGGHLTIYYGSQTGTAQMFAKQIASESESRGFCARIVDLQDVVDNDDVDSIEAESKAVDGSEYATIDEDGALIRATLAHPHYRDLDDDDENGHDNGKRRSKALFFMATYGEGEPTDNAQQFVEMMKSKSGISNIYKIETPPGSNGKESLVSPASTMSLEDITEEDTAAAPYSPRDATFLRDLDYAVFGLGNKQYEHYNNMSRFMDAALEQCGAKRVAAIGLGDDDDDLEGDFETWKDDVLWPSLTETYVKGAVMGAAANKKEGEGMALSLPPCPYLVEYLKTDDDKTAISKSLIQTSSKHYSQAVDCPIVARRELRDPSDPGSTVHMEIDISNHMDTCRYQTADNLGILPKNDSSVVESVAKALNYDLDRQFHLLPNTATDQGDASSKHTLPFPTPCTVRECLERYCDLTGPPRRSDLKQFAPYARDEMDRKALLRMSSKEGKAEYKEKIVEAHVGVADIVTRLCPSIACPLEHFVMVCPRLQPRYYTISSSSTVFPETIHITLAVLETEKKDGGGGVFKGLCSGYLAGMTIGDTVRVFVRESTFRLPKQVERPVLMFGPGTGIAPMRAILQERSHGRKNMGAEQHGASILYFGCKQRSMDYIYRDELESFCEEGTLTELHLAFSREQAQKVYVQHLLVKRAKETWKLIHEDKASIFVCGAVKMGADVDHTLQDIISEHGGMTREKAKAYLDKMAVAGRFVQELWS
eukprot:CAMPEP_0201885002 /NCGR_PEP_ID=MMETSP0902-20130614/17667_1 /ASSEMBLY_ACC=CAM_ASM_000551 /TAXON_ID=420261 /ORGANISM="Thalassiosira antarctica, Strain CCMP982" /LENGTH=727 /DNA_ID=CAMNT_0048414025 /DNA_START=323 /DNA_END=2506 /DNA_ORIENTATION=+